MSAHRFERLSQNATTRKLRPHGVDAADSDWPLWLVGGDLAHFCIQIQGENSDLTDVNQYKNIRIMKI
ncbi:hypothetical protein BSE24067_06509 [Burkholderia seminalis]|nr:hypothetical protein BSE24067_06509 [Burkholderia seminalis]